MRSISKLYNKSEIRRLKKDADKIVGIISKISENLIEYNGPRNDVNLILVEVIILIKKLKGIEIRENQIISALALIKGLVVELDTGEGKSIAVCMAAVVLAQEKKVYIATVNEYLAERDANEFREIYEYFNLKVGYNYRKANKSDVYNTDIVYSSSVDLIFDYLSENHSEEKVGIELECAILDEVDYILMDNANSTFSISNGSMELDDNDDFRFAINICRGLKGIQGYHGNDTYLNNKIECEYDYVYILGTKQVYLTQSGIEKLNNIYTYRVLMKDHGRVYNILLNCIKALSCFKKGEDYIIDAEKGIVLINRENGYPMENSKYLYELQRAIEVKEGIQSSYHGNLSDGMSYQVFFNKFKFWTGLSGTVSEVEEELSALYNKQTLIISRHTRNIRIDEDDIIMNSYVNKMEQILSDACEYQDKGLPVIVVCVNEIEAENLFCLFSGKKQVQLFSATNMGCEKDVINSAGKSGVITITTSLLSRGVHIEVEEKVSELGGLVVILTSRFNSLRVENQIRGRTARQGNPGLTKCYISLEDKFWDNMVESEIDKFKSIKNSNTLSKESLVKLKKLIKTLNLRIYYRTLYTRNAIYKLEQIQDNYRSRFFEVCNVVNDVEDQFFYELVEEMLENTEMNNDEEIISKIISNIEQKVDNYGVQVVRKLLFNITLNKVVEFYSYFRDNFSLMSTNFLVEKLAQKTESDFLVSVDKMFYELFNRMLFEIFDLVYRAEERK